MSFEPRGDTEDRIRQIAERLAPIYQAQEWSWIGCGVPDVDEIERTLAELALSVLGTPRNTSASTGRLTVERNCWFKGHDETCNCDVRVLLDLGDITEAT